MDRTANQRWYSPPAGVATTGPVPDGGEVRVQRREYEHTPGQGYFLVTSPNVADAEHAEDGQALWLSNQLNGAVADERYDQDFSWVNSVVDPLLVPDEHCKFAWGAARGRYKDASLMPDLRAEFADIIAIILVADIYNDPEDPSRHFRIATHPIGPWGERVAAIEQGLRSMAMQRYAREQLVARAAVDSKEIHGFFGTPHPLPGLRLTRRIERERTPDETDEQWMGDVGRSWDLTSERGGLELPEPVQKG